MQLNDNALSVFLYDFFIAHFPGRFHGHSLPFVQEHMPFYKLFTLWYFTRFCPIYREYTKQER